MLITSTLHVISNLGTYMWSIMHAQLTVVWSAAGQAVVMVRRDPVTLTPHDTSGSFYSSQDRKQSINVMLDES